MKKQYGNSVGATSTPRACISCSSFHFTQLIDSRPHFEETAKEKNGITLIALIITIIVMLILVGVTINVTINGGLLDIAKKAAQRTERAQWKENLNATLIAMNTEIYAELEIYTIDTREQADIVKALTKVLNEIEKSFELDSKYIYEAEGVRTLDIEKLALEGYSIIDDDTELLKTIIVPCKFEGQEIELCIDINANQDNGTLKIAEFYIERGSKLEINDEPVEIAIGGNIVSVTEDEVPIPKGFYYVTGTKDTGVVISDSQADENNEEGSNGNQFVWIPVNVNPKLNIEIDAEKVIQEVRILSTTGYDETINVDSDYFQKTINLTHNDVYEVIIKYIDGTTEDILKEVNTVYEINNRTYGSIKQLSFINEINKEDYLETNIKNLLLENDSTLELNTNIDIINTFEKVFTQRLFRDDASEVNNVLKYGGFYIGRYETKLTDGVPTIKKKQTPTHSITYEDAKSAIESLYTDADRYGVTADLPSGAAWDYVGNWLIGTGAKSEKGVYGNSTGWGNFRVSANNKNYKLKVTGASESYEANNIYDLAGNLEEWTKEIAVGAKKEIDPETGQEKEEPLGNCARGGQYNDLNYTTYSNISPSLETTNKIGFRPMLYIND